MKTDAGKFGVTQDDSVSQSQNSKGLRIRGKGNETNAKTGSREKFASGENFLSSMLKSAIVFPNLSPARIVIYCVTFTGGDMASTWIAKPKVHAEVQFSS